MTRIIRYLNSGNDNSGNDAGERPAIGVACDDGTVRPLPVSSLAELHRQRERATALGAQLLLDRTDDPTEPLYVFADPSGHPFCVFVR